MLYISGAAESPWVNKAPASCQVLNLCSKKSFLNKQREILLFAVLLREVLGIGRSRSWWQAKLCCSTEQSSSSAERANAAAGQWSSLPGCHALLCVCIQDFSVLQAGGQKSRGAEVPYPSSHPAEPVEMGSCAGIEGAKWALAQHLTSVPPFGAV